MAGAETLPWHRGIAADDPTAAARPLGADPRVEDLSHRAGLRGHPVSDERHAPTARI
ncbi:hypothetical protein [Streptomyces sp. enrichment culture]|uniref:hypothetical protein n=1 Tax=Streptomyces sp. enrichment culture TaxID=1795815 RepID=UPI003F5762F1